VEATHGDGYYDPSDKEVRLMHACDLFGSVLAPIIVAVLNLAWSCGVMYGIEAYIAKQRWIALAFFFISAAILLYMLFIFNLMIRYRWFVCD